jgi:hypothetical protein
MAFPLAPDPTLACSPPERHPPTLMSLTLLARQTRVNTPELATCADLTNEQTPTHALLLSWGEQGTLCIVRCLPFPSPDGCAALSWRAGCQLRRTCNLPSHHPAPVISSLALLIARIGFLKDSSRFVAPCHLARFPALHSPLWCGLTGTCTETCKRLVSSIERGEADGGG